MKKFLSLVFIASGLGFAAPPDCQYSYKFTNRPGDQTDGVTQISGANPAPAINNKDNACTGWVFTYDSEGFTAISINLQSAPNVINAPDVISQGAWSTYSGTAVLGSLPMTSTANGTYIGYTYYPWIRVNLTSATGTGSINVKLQGWKSPAYVASLGSSGGSGTPSGSNGDVQIKNGSNFAASTCNDDGTDLTCTGKVIATNGLNSGSGATPGLDDDFCGTAPSSPSAGHVYGYCTSKVPLWKNEDGTVYGMTDATIQTSDVTTNNASTSKHGFVPKLPNDATKYYDGTGSYSVPSGGSSSSLGNGALWAPIPFANPFLTATAAQTANVTYVWKFSIPAGMTINNILTWGGGGGSGISFGIYDVDGSGNCNTLVAHTTPATLSASAANTLALTAGYSITAGTYFMAVTSDGTANTGYVPAPASGILAGVMNAGTLKNAGTANVSTGSGGSLAFNSTCGTVTTAGGDVGWFVFLAS